MVIQERHKDPYRAFFTVDQAIGDYMVSLLAPSEHDLVLEPSAGKGHLIDAVKRVQPFCSITAYEIDSNQTDALHDKFPEDPNVHIFRKDTIFCPDLDLREGFGPRFTKIIGNPPYGGWQDYNRRIDLKKRFSGFYVRETYTLFLLRCLRLLERDGKLVFIIPNTFLYLNMHAPLRTYILENFSIETIDIFKSSLFSGISFGYADLCIISIAARRADTDHSIRLRNVTQLSEFTSGDHVSANARFVQQRSFLNSSSRSISLSSPINSEICFMHETTMADLADCVTGFYSGNDKKYLRKADPAVKRSSGYETVDKRLIINDLSQITAPLEGVDGDHFFIPILKGGGFQFFKPTMWFVNWSKEAVRHYKSDHKARFQNSSYYFQKGIGFPMVTSTQPTAAIIEDSLFDQSVVGIFPKNIELEFLLAYCNSIPFWACLKSINPSANNSAKYVLRTPIIRPDQELETSIAIRTKELLTLLKNKRPGVEKLRREILESVVRYVRDKSSKVKLHPIVQCAVAQL